MLAEVNNNLAKCQHMEEELKKTRFEADLIRATSIMVQVSKVDQVKLYIISFKYLASIMLRTEDILQIQSFKF